MDVKVKIEGAKELDRVLKDLPPKVAQKALESAVRSGANLIRKEVRESAPVRTGLLKRNVIVKKNKQGEASVNFHVGTSSKVFYGHFVEFGTVKMKPRPFFRPAFERVAQDAIDKIGERLAVTITNEALKLAGQYKTKGRRR